MRRARYSKAICSNLNLFFFDGSTSSLDWITLKPVSTHTCSDKHLKGCTHKYTLLFRAMFPLWATNQTFITTRLRTYNIFFFYLFPFFLTMTESESELVAMYAPVPTRNSSSADGVAEEIFLVSTCALHLILKTVSQIRVLSILDSSLSFIPPLHCESDPSDKACLYY